MSRAAPVTAALPMLVLSGLLLPALAGCLEGTRPDQMGTTTATAGPPVATPHAVIAHMDTGINPYHAAFRWNDTRAWQHPSTWLPGYPADATALWLTLNATDYDTAFTADRAAWESLANATLYWVPGTRIIGGVSFEPGGTNCPAVEVPPANQFGPGQGCPEHKVLDDHGHGTMTASRMAGDTQHSLCPDCLIVSVEGANKAALDWIAAARFIDVVSNSWLTLTPGAAEGPLAESIRNAADRSLFLFASGNGAGKLQGVVGEPTYGMTTGPDNVIMVGAHDNGLATTWHGFPAHVVADGYGGWMAHYRSLDEVSASPEACCTSAAAPYASGGAAAILLRARQLLGDTHVGWRGEGDEAVVAERAADPADATGTTAAEDALPGPLADGRLTAGELKRLLLATANPRPGVSNVRSDDGLVNWAGTGKTPENPWPGDNPYCVGCFTSPVPLSKVPAEVSLVGSVGYGAVTRDTLSKAFAVLRGDIALPERPDEDRFFAADRQLRQVG